MTRKQRKSPRLPGYDYSAAGAYFVTICTHQRQYYFGTIQNDAMHYTAIGKIADSAWQSIPRVFPSVICDGFVVMPNHVHGILIFSDETSIKRPTLGSVIGNYKATVTRRAKQQEMIVDLPLWQARFHDHIIRSEKSYRYIQRYIQENVARWQEDSLREPY